jgi:hypothetical protein
MFTAPKVKDLSLTCGSLLNEMSHTPSAYLDAEGTSDGGIPVCESTREAAHDVFIDAGRGAAVPVIKAGSRGGRSNLSSGLWTGA